MATHVTVRALLLAGASLVLPTNARAVDPAPAVPEVANAPSLPPTLSAPTAAPETITNPTRTTDPIVRPATGTDAPNPVATPAGELVATPQTGTDPLNPVAKLLGSVPLTLNGYFWVDTGVMNRLNAQAGQYDLLANYMQGRIVLGAQYDKWLGDWFARGRVEYLGLVNEFSKSQYESHTLDAYAMVGTKAWNFQIGRFLPWETYHRGQGIELFTAEESGAQDAPGLYWGNFARRYFDEAGQAAVHWYPTDWLNFEVSGVYGQQDSQNFLGVRPVVIAKAAGFTLAAGWEYLRQDPQKDADKVRAASTGFSGKLQYDLPFLTIGVNAGQGSVEQTRIEGDLNSEASLTKWSAGAFANVNLWRHSLGLGYHRTDQVNGQTENNMQDQAFVSYLYQLPFEGLSVKAVYGFARAHIQDVDLKSEWDNDLHSFRVRLAYDFK